MRLRGVLVAAAVCLSAFATAPAADAAKISTPTVTGLSSYFSLPTGGAKVTVTGANLRGATQVLFGGVAATNLAVVSNSAITATVPAHAAGTVDVTVVTTKARSASTTGSLFTYHAKAPTGATVTAGTYVPELYICQAGATCKPLQVTTAGFAAAVTCRVTDSDTGAFGGPWTQGANAVYGTGFMMTSSFVEVTCDGVTVRKSPL